MASIMCGQNLWRALLEPGRRRRRTGSLAAAEPVFQNVLFGPWAANVLREDGRDYVIALDAAAFLTVVFSLGRREAFRHEFGRAVAAALRDLAAPAHVVALESSVIEVLPTVRLSDVRLRRELEYASDICGIELAYHDDLNRVQRNLNELPHGGRDPGVPAQAVAALVGRTVSEWDPSPH